MIARSSSRARFRRLFLAATFAVACTLTFPDPGASFSLFGPATPGDTGNIQDFGKGFRWGVDSNLTYSIDQTFLDAYGESGGTAVRNAVSTWDNAFGVTSGPASTVIHTGSTLFDLETIALHELGHAFGLTHPDLGAAIGKNFDAAGNPIASSGSEIMNSTIALGDIARQLTNDELVGLNYLYNPSLMILGFPGLGDLDLTEAPGAALEGITVGANIDFFAAPGSHSAFGGATNVLAVAQVNMVFAAETDGAGIINGQTGLLALTHQVAGVDIFFNTDFQSQMGILEACGTETPCEGSSVTVPEPGMLALLIIGLGFLLLVPNTVGPRPL